MENTANKVYVMTLRLPAALAEQIKQIAKDHKRSLRAEIEMALEEYSKRHKEADEQS
jgi:hypothetical protein